MKRKTTAHRNVEKVMDEESAAANILLEALSYYMKKSKDNKVAIKALHDYEEALENFTGWRDCLKEPKEREFNIRVLPRSRK